MKPINYPPKKKSLEPGVNDLLTLYPEISTELKSASPSEVMATSVKKQSWECSLCGKTWMTAPKSRVSALDPRPGCPTCKRSSVAGIRKKRPLLATIFPDLSKEVVDSVERSSISMSSHRDILWECQRGHQYEMSPNKRVNGRGCPVCAFRKLDASYNSIGAVRPDLVKDLVNQSDAVTVMANSKEPISWTHTIDGVDHFWEAAPNSRCYFDYGCLVCDGTQVQVGVNDFGITLARLGYIWADDNQFLPSEVSVGSNKKVRLICDKHEGGFPMECHAKNFTSGNRQCQDCIPTADRFRSKPEIRLFEAIRDALPGHNVESNVRRYHSDGVRELDILVDGRVAVDFNGTHWHQEGVFKPVGYHARKRASVAAIGIAYLEVEEADYRADPDGTVQVAVKFVADSLGLSIPG